MPTDFFVTALAELRPELDVSAGCHVLVFYATWTPPARMVFHSCDELAGEFSGDAVGFHFFEADARVAALAPHVPLVVLVRAGREVHRFSGAVPKPVLKQAVLDLISTPVQT